MKLNVLSIFVAGIIIAYIDGNGVFSKAKTISDTIVDGKLKTIVIMTGLLATAYTSFKSYKSVVKL